MIIAWGVEFGKCAPYSGYGFRQVFDNSADADRYVQVQCTKIARNDLEQYAIYLTNEFCSIDEVMHYHNWKDSDSHYRDGNDRIEEINVEEVKNYIDIEYQMYKRRESESKMNIQKEVNNMSSYERQRQAKLFKEVGLLNDK